MHITEITPATAAEIGTSWQRHPEAARILDALGPDDLFITRPMVVMGTDELRVTTDRYDDLAEVRTDLIDLCFGSTFREALEQGKPHDYLDFEASWPTVQDVLRERFGDPNELAGFSLADAQVRYRHGVTRIGTLDQQVAEAREAMGEARWDQLNREWAA
ncbi:hypothetical protein I5E68_07225 [Novosphingobium sp. YJ-S2-02]|uniref:Uncharacterized protein n=1 Tax=Novosphingobium aureum TaxID=2792964 RepID=A0A931HBG4_9SPHN|nr:hypothetical protein [Novosphingobium aureum]MBH0112742.1 hypothetical protein [Novosphingobium aureum]